MTIMSMAADVDDGRCWLGSIGRRKSETNGNQNVTNVNEKITHKNLYATIFFENLDCRFIAITKHLVQLVTKLIITSNSTRLKMILNF